MAEVSVNTLWIFSIEPINTRYTGQWHTHVPALFKKQAKNKINVVQIDGKTMPGKLKNGEFLDFASTNQWKNEQANKFFELLKKGKVHKNDQLLFMDAWNPVIPQIKYVNDLRNLQLKMHGLWHAGSYDPHDFLGRLIGDADWVRNLERAIYYSLDHNYFATEFHLNMFAQVLSNEKDLLGNKAILTGWPFEYLEAEINKVKNGPRRDLILFPHRIAPEKQLDIFTDLAKSMPQYEWKICQKTPLTKNQYHKMLLEAKIVFSANLQETLGISTCAEGPLAGAIPLAPNRLSYQEVFNGMPEFIYPSKWTQSFDAYLQNKEKLMDKITHIMKNYELYEKSLDYYFDSNYDVYFSADKLVKFILK